jgi:GNAT superfamily N-acetyltransferase
VLTSGQAAERVEQADGDYLAARVGALAAMPGNPYGAVVRRVGAARAFLVAGLPNAVFNHVTGLTEADAGQLGELAGWYAGNGRRIRVELTPAQASPALFEALTGHGLAQTGFYAGLYAGADTGPTAGHGGQADGAPPAGEVAIAEADPDEFARHYVAGFGFPDRLRAGMQESIRVLAGCPGALFYLARIGSQPAGVGLLFVADGTGYLATAATLPAARGRGVHAALIRHRISAATAAGCDLIVGHAAAGSVSQHGMERCGLRLAYTKAIWTGPAAPPR